MSAIGAELDRMDAATADMFIKLQLLDIRTSAHAIDGALKSAGQWDNTIAMQEYEAELKRYRTRRGLSSDELPVPEPEKMVEVKARPGPDTAHDHTHIPMGVCLACSDRLPLAELYDCPCRPDPTPHRWCEECLEHLHRSALTDETLYPPRCCQHVFDFDYVKIYLTHNLIEDFEAKQEELDDTNRIYCYVPTCSAYIGADHRQDTLAHCSNDDHEPTCIMCKNAKHDGECEQDMGRRQVEATAAQNGWQTCSACKAVVELNTGCYHITCRCSHQFCYICGTNWKDCNCPQWDEGRLLRRAAAVVDREGGEAENQEAVDAMARQLRDHHGCPRGDHSWRWTDEGQFRCDGCHDMLTKFIFRCRQCHTQNCYRCRLNRN